MKRGEKGILIGMVVVVLTLMVVNFFRQQGLDEHAKDIPFYTTANPELSRQGGLLYKRLACKKCHSLWTVKDIMQTVPAPAMDGMGSLRSEDWLFKYFSAENPQAILSSRLKKEFQMPSYSALSLDDRKLLSAYISSLKVEDWYLEETKRAECKKLTGEAC